MLSVRLLSRLSTKQPKIKKAMKMEGCTAQIREVAQSAISQPGHGVRSSVVGGVNRASPEESQHAARHRILQLEAALAAFSDSKGAEVTMLQGSLRSASRAAQVPPLGVQLAQCEQFASRSEAVCCIGRGTSQIGVRVEEGQARLQRLRVETAQRPQDANPAAPMPPPGWAAELQRLRSLVTQLQEERIQQGPRHLEEELQDLRWEVDALRHERDSLVAERGAVGSDTTMAVVGVIGPSSDRMAALIEEGEMKMEAALTTI